MSNDDLMAEISESIMPVVIANNEARRIHAKHMSICVTALLESAMEYPFGSVDSRMRISRAKNVAEDLSKEIELIDSDGDE